MLTTGDWFKFLEERREEKTLDTYRSLIAGYARSMERKAKGLVIEDFRPMDIEHHMNTYAPRSANTFLAAVKSYMKWVRMNQYIGDVETLLLVENLNRGIDMIEFRRVPQEMKTEALTVDSLKLLISAMENDDLLRAATVTHFTFGARPAELSTPFKVKRLDPGNARIENAVDYERHLISIVTAKSNRTRFRMLPFPGEIEEDLRRWVNWTKKLEAYKYPQQWYTKSLLPYARMIGFKVSAKTGRKTVETELSRRMVTQWEIDVWLGHTESVSGEYRDRSILIEELRRDISDRHFILEAI